jgi:AraC family transcriptional regulator of adaptative response/methylated-DNA-[protein]-cysteine methyltransferase
MASATKTKPQGRGDARIEALCAYLRTHSDEAVPLAELARRSGLSPFHLQRLFKAVVGLTPRQYAEACRLESFKKGLRAAPSVTEAIYAAGFGSSSRLYEKVPTRLGMTPTEYRSGGQGTAISAVIVPTPLGLLLIAATDRGLCAVQFGDSRAALQAALRVEYPAATILASPSQGSPQLQAWIEALRRYLGGDRHPLHLPLDVQATAFRFRVWQYLQTIPPGTVQSYAEVARRLGRPSAARAVANACAANRVALAIPCHRVIRGDGGMGGYRWGIPRKERLLALEKKR